MQNHENVLLRCDGTIAASSRPRRAPRKLSSFLTFQGVPAAVSPHHNVKLKVGHGVISGVDSSPPPYL